MPGLTKSSFIDIRFHGELCRLYADASLFLPDEQTLILSDLHLQKGFAQSKGAPLPGYDTQDTLNRAELTFAICHMLGLRTVEQQEAAA